MGIGNFPLAIADFTEAIRLDPVKRSFRFYDRANALRKAGQYADAIPDYDEVLQLDPTNGWAFFDRGRTYANIAQIASATNDFEAALLVPDVSPELRQAVAEALAALVPPPPPPPPPPPDVRPQRLSALIGIRDIIEQRLPSIHFPDLRRQADEVLAKLAAANLDTYLRSWTISVVPAIRSSNALMKWTNLIAFPQSPPDRQNV
jgi:tetratricopeptide (TPR) repeat protein